MEVRHSMGGKPKVDFDRGGGGGGENLKPSITGPLNQKRTAFFVPRYSVP